jgi:putative hemolysin
VIYILRFFSILFSPILIVFVTLSKFLSRLAGSRDEHNPFTLREQIQSMVQMPPQEGGDIQAIEKTMIRRMFNFSETTVYKVMVPLIDVNAVEKHCTVGEAVRLAVESSHVRLPVYDGRIDRVIGVLNTMDLLGVDQSLSIEGFISPTRYVPASKSAESMLVELRKDGDAMAVVMDEFGGAEGIVTIEDIIEEVVEDMQDEYDRQEKPAEWLKKLGHHDYLVSARADPTMLIEKLGLKLPGDGSYDTLSGFLLEYAREIPKPGNDDRGRRHQVHDSARDTAGHPGSADPLVAVPPLAAVLCRRPGRPRVRTGRTAELRPEIWTLARPTPAS